MTQPGLKARTQLFPVGLASPKQKHIRLPVDDNGQPIKGTLAWMRLIVKAVERDSATWSAFERAAVLGEIEECKQRDLRERAEAHTCNDCGHKGYGGWNCNQCGSVNITMDSL